VCVLHYLLLGDSLLSGDFSSFGIYLTCIPTQQPKQKEISLERWYYCRAYFQIWHQRLVLDDEVCESRRERGH
jgi:hypothetical protein